RVEGQPDRSGGNSDMARRLAGTAALWVLIGAGLLAADFWEEKPFLTWSDKEVDRIITDSPWAQRLTVVNQGSPTPSIAGGAVGGGDDGGGRGGRGGRGGGGGGGVTLRLTITWRSALPIKE